MAKAAQTAGPLIAIADDHPLMRKALAQALQDLEPPPRVAEATTVSETLALVASDPTPDLLLMDLRMPDAQGTDGIRAVRLQAPDVPLAVISADEDVDTVGAVLALGVAGFIPKTDSAAIVASAVRLILAGGCYVPPRLMRAGGALAPVTNDPALTLTARQREVLKLLAQGLSNKAIARELGVTDGTVKVHLLAVFRALNVRNRTAAVLAAQKLTS